MAVTEFQRRFMFDGYGHGGAGGDRPRPAFVKAARPCPSEKSILCEFSGHFDVAENSRRSRGSQYRKGKKGAGSAANLARYLERFTLDLETHKNQPGLWRRGAASDEVVTQAQFCSSLNNSSTSVQTSRIERDKRSCFDDNVRASASDQLQRAACKAGRSNMRPEYPPSLLCR